MDLSGNQQQIFYNLRIIKIETKKKSKRKPRVVYLLGCSETGVGSSRATTSPGQTPNADCNQRKLGKNPRGSLIQRCIFECITMSSQQLCVLLKKSFQPKGINTSFQPFLTLIFKPKISLFSLFLYHKIILTKSPLFCEGKGIYIGGIQGSEMGENYQKLLRGKTQFEIQNP